MNRDSSCGGKDYFVAVATPYDTQVNQCFVRIANHAECVRRTCKATAGMSLMIATELQTDERCASYIAAAHSVQVCNTL